MKVLVPNVHRAAEHQQCIVGLERRDGLARFEVHRVPRDVVALPEFAKDARMLDRHVLENEETHQACSCKTWMVCCWSSGRNSASTPCTLELSPMSLLCPGLRTLTLAPFGSSFGQRPLCT